MNKFVVHFSFPFQGATTSRKSGFTLLELLIVIAIVGTISVSLVLVINPGEALKKARDAQRISDLTTIKKVLGIYLTTSPSVKLAGVSNAGCRGTSASSTWQPSDYIYYSYPSDSPGAPITDKTIDGVTFTTGGPVQVTKANLGNTDGTGWIPIDFSTLSGGSPISNLPIDPINTIADPSNVTSSDLVYRYICSEKTLQFKLAAALESTAYTVTNNKMAADGGTSDSYYEVGTDLSLLTVESLAVATAAPVAVGDSYQGGKVAYILQSGDPGYDPGVQHGLIAADADQSTSVPWALSWTFTGATATAIGTGLSNTNTIIASLGGTPTDYAAGLARSYNGGGYSDWYLPSKDELDKLYLNKDMIGVFTSNYYWSSSDINMYNAHTLHFLDGVPQDSWSKSSTFTASTLAIRSF